MQKIASYLLAVVALSFATVAKAEYPERPITLIVPFAAGGGSDRTARLVVPYLEKYLGADAKIAVVNKPGAGGSIAYTALASSSADGYVIGMVNFPDVVTGPIVSDVKYSVGSFDFLGAINAEPTTILVRSDSPYRNLEEFISAAKKNPGALSVGVPSMRNVHSVGLTIVSAQTNAIFNKIPLKGGGPTMNALLGGHIDAAALSMGAAAKRAGKVRILGQMSVERVSTGADVPTFEEAIGLKIENHVYRTFAVPDGLPDETLAALRSAFSDAMADDELRAAATKQRVDLTYIEGDDLVAISSQLKSDLTTLWETNPWMTKN